MKSKPATHTLKNCNSCQPVEIETGIGMFPDGIRLCPLHAAAPEMLEELKRAERAIKMLLEFHGWNVKERSITRDIRTGVSDEETAVWKLLDSIRAAISKAEGRNV